MIPALASVYLRLYVECLACMKLLLMAVRDDDDDDVDDVDVCQVRHVDLLRLVLRAVVLPRGSAPASEDTSSASGAAVGASSTVVLDTSGSDPVLEWAVFLTSVLLTTCSLTRCVQTLSQGEAGSELLVLTHLVLACYGMDHVSGLVDNSEQACNGVVPAGLLDACCAYVAAGQTNVDSGTAAAAAATAAAEKERQCEQCRATAGRMLKCSVCRQTYYCSVDCQRTDWRTHKPLCDALAKVAKDREDIALKLTFDARHDLLLLLAYGVMVLRERGEWYAPFETAMCTDLLPVLFRDVVQCEAGAGQPWYAVGFISTAMRFVSNAASCGATAFKDAVLAHGGLAVVLNHCKVDVKQPMVREWSLASIKHLCEDHAGVQAAIAGMKAIAVEQSPELAALGVKASLTADGKVAIEKK